MTTAAQFRTQSESLREELLSAVQAQAKTLLAPLILLRGPAAEYIFRLPPESPPAHLWIGTPSSLMANTRELRLAFLAGLSLDAAGSVQLLVAGNPDNLALSPVALAWLAEAELIKVLAEIEEALRSRRRTASGRAP